MNSTTIFRKPLWWWWNNNQNSHNQGNNNTTVPSHVASTSLLNTSTNNTALSVHLTKTQLVFILLFALLVLLILLVIIIYQCYYHQELKPAEAKLETVVECDNTISDDSNSSPPTQHSTLYHLEADTIATCTTITMNLSDSSFSPLFPATVSRSTSRFQEHF